MSFLHIMTNCYGIFFYQQPPGPHNNSHRSTVHYQLTSCLHGADKLVPAHLWCRTINQINIQVNILQQSRINPRQSAYTELYGQFYFNATPLAPIGIEAIIFHPRDNGTTSYSDHGKKWLLHWSLPRQILKLQSICHINKRYTRKQPR